MSQSGWSDKQGVAYYGSSGYGYKRVDLGSYTFTSMPVCYIINGIYFYPMRRLFNGSGNMGNYASVRDYYVLEDRATNYGTSTYISFVSGPDLIYETTGSYSAMGKVWVYFTNNYKTLNFVGFTAIKTDTSMSISVPSISVLY